MLLAEGSFRFDRGALVEYRRGQYCLDSIGVSASSGSGCYFLSASRTMRGLRSSSIPVDRDVASGLERLSGARKVGPGASVSCLGDMKRAGFGQHF